MRNPSKKTMKHIASVLNSHCRFDSNKQILVPFESSPLSCIWYSDYWHATEGNAKRALYGLLAFAKMRPDGVWDGD